MGVTFEGKIYNDQQSFDLPNDKSGTIALTSDVGASYFVYTALLSQSGTNAPVATVLENTLGFSHTLLYSSEGNFVLYFPVDNLFPTNKTLKFIENADAINSNAVGFNMIAITNESDFVYNAINIGCFDYLGAPTNDQLKNTSIEIRVYP